jgi:hypothetical protein
MTGATVTSVELAPAFARTGTSANLQCACGHNGGGICGNGVNAGDWGACGPGGYGDSCSTGNYYNHC